MNNLYIDRPPIFQIKKSDICAEIGVWRGDFSQNILNQQPAKLHLIDSWQWKEDWDEAYFYAMLNHKGKDESAGRAPQQELDMIYNSVCERFANESTVTIHREHSNKVTFPPEYFDWVYIDGDHDYEGALADLEYYYPLIKKGGLLCGDDYGDFGKNGGPERAVKDFVKKYNLHPHIIPDLFNTPPNWTPQFIIPIT